MPTAVATEMFCYQCEQTAHGTGCTSLGICGKTPETAALQDVIVYLVKNISQFAHHARQLNLSDPEINHTTLEALFMTLTNVNFDSDAHVQYIQYLIDVLGKAKSMYREECTRLGKTPENIECDIHWCKVEPNYTNLLKIAEELSIPQRCKAKDEDLASLEELLTYGIKGTAAYAHHARLLGYEDEAIYAYIHRAFCELMSSQKSLEELLKLNLECGEINFKVMELLDKAHTERFGHPVPTQVLTTPVIGKAILISGHDMNALYELLKQTEGTGINVYTHGEMLPAHGYPGLKKFKHLIGNYGGAWQNQQIEFDEFPGAILMTTNCLKPPSVTYKNRLFTMDVVGWEGVTHIKNYDFKPLIDSALASPGFLEAPTEKTILVGFGHNAVINVADKVIDAVKSGQVKHFFLIGGCDGAEYNRNYYSHMADKAPQDSMILTLGCGKYRFNHHEFGTVAGLPRLLDIGQCNDTYSAVKIATALAEAFKCGINDLPLSMIISWFEQKAVAVLLTLLYLGVKNIRLGPQLPAFITPNVLKVLVDNYHIMPIGNPEQDMEAILSPTTV